MIMFALMILSLMHCIIHKYLHRKTKKNYYKKKKTKNKHVVASFASLGLSLQHIGLHSCCIWNNDWDCLIA